MFGRRGPRTGGSGVLSNVPNSALLGNDLRSITDTETATQASGKTLTLPTPGHPVYMLTTATGTTGRYQLTLPNGEVIDFECVPNAPPQPYPIPDVFGTQTTKVVFSVITVDGTGTIVGKVLYRPTVAA